MGGWAAGSFVSNRQGMSQVHLSVCRTGPIPIGPVCASPTNRQLAYTTVSGDAFTQAVRSGSVAIEWRAYDWKLAAH